MGTPGDTLSAEAAAEAARLVDEGFDAWLKGDFVRAVSDLSRAVAAYRKAPATIPREPSLRDGLFRALVGLALAHMRQGNARESISAMSELVLGFPDRAVDRATYGPEAVDLYRRVKRELEEQAPGALRIAIDDATAVVFINERYLTVGPTTVAKLIPGRYRVYAQRGSQPGRVRSRLEPVS